ncbi:MAG: hypothetical protein U0946_06420 [Patescibacteria group bacterium]|nr:hypothetical protein [Patescibacteria group bacterium]
MGVEALKLILPEKLQEIDGLELASLFVPMLSVLSDEGLDGHFFETPDSALGALSLAMGIFGSVWWGIESGIMMTGKMKNGPDKFFAGLTGGFVVVSSGVFFSFSSPLAGAAIGVSAGIRVFSLVKGETNEK